MPKYETADSAKDDMPLKGTMEMLGVKPDGAENKAESSESYRDIGEQRLAAATETLGPSPRRRDQREHLNGQVYRI